MRTVANRLCGSILTIGICTGCADDVSSRYPECIGRQYVATQRLLIVKSHASNYDLAVPYSTLLQQDYSGKQQPPELAAGTRVRVVEVAERSQGGLIGWTAISLIAEAENGSHQGLRFIVAAGPQAAVNSDKPDAYFRPVE